jgi:hypothetical protein
MSPPIRRRHTKRTRCPHRPCGGARRAPAPAPAARHNCLPPVLAPREPKARARIRAVGPRWLLAPHPNALPECTAPPGGGPFPAAAFPGFHPPLCFLCPPCSVLPRAAPLGRSAWDAPQRTAPATRRRPTHSAALPSDPFCPHHFLHPVAHAHVHSPTPRTRQRARRCTAREELRRRDGATVGAVVGGSHQPPPPPSIPVRPAAPRRGDARYLSPLPCVYAKNACAGPIQACEACVSSMQRPAPPPSAGVARRCARRVWGL